MSSVLAKKNNHPDPFNSFWMAGYECADHLNAFGNRVDLLHQTSHLALLNEDYASLEQVAISTVREGIRWSSVEKRPYEYDWSSVIRMIHSARSNNIQQIWDICHFGFPDDLTPFHPMFARRFAFLCREFVKMYRSIEPYKQLIVVPINEVSFLSWLGGDARGTSPYCINSGWELKYSLMRAFIEGAHAMKEIDPEIIIHTTEPLVNFVPADCTDSDLVMAAAIENEHQYQSVDILTGRICPELGGQENLLDILGFNFYYNNQWIHGSSDFLPWFNENNDPRWKSLSNMLINAYLRYERPFVISETSHCGDHRPNWLEFITKEACKVIEAGYPLKGICLYPIINRPDWDQLHDWHTAGLWDLKVNDENLGYERILHQPYAAELVLSQQKIESSFEKIKPGFESTEKVFTAV